MAINVHIGTVNITGMDSAALGEQLRLPSLSVLEGSVPASIVDYSVIGALAQEDTGAETNGSAPADSIPLIEAVPYQAAAERSEGPAVAATARRNFLRNLVMHVDRGRRLEGFQTNHQARPNDMETVSKRQHGEMVMAAESLLSACGACALSEHCKLARNLGAWIDFHPYKSGPKGRRRPGSVLPPHLTESRTVFLKALAKDPLAHCDPRKR